MPAATPNGPLPHRPHRILAGATLALACTAFLLLVAPYGFGGGFGAEAAARREAFEAGDWTGWAFFNEAGRFRHCAITQRHEDGVRLFFSLTGNREFALGLMKPDWQLKERGRYKVRLAIDAFWERSIVAEAPGERLLLVPLPFERDFLHTLRRAYTLTVDDGFTPREFALRGTWEALPKLEACVKARAD